MTKLTSILGWIVKNVGLIVSVVEGIIKVLGGIASLTPTEKDDKLVQWLTEHNISSKIQKVADFLGQYGT